ncbi:CHAD domain-containing protein [Rhizobium leguminosarum bv. viciae]|uniref:CYTH and CHAD domain-containing protein n=1 Tax=Rhizobium leguminosarum TaxID=384 RepID=UPI00197E749D|nr:CHAD domain-containing protein [Rhizobium leguminosarum]NKK68667.1 CHAD domain-containing protein [Rhizobium leguminosarum bv. viciae]
MGAYWVSSEIELKLELAPEALDKLLTSDILGAPDETLSQRSTYFDTADWKLFREGFTLRVRKTGDAYVQTVKATGPSKSHFARAEWESAVPGNRPVFDHSNPLKAEFGVDIQAHPIFDVEIERRVWNIEENGSKIEFVIDQGAAIAGERRAPVYEAELELKDGRQRALFALARTIEAIAPVKLGVRSKAERGYILVERQQTVFKAERLDLDKYARASVAFQTIAASCFRQFRLNEDVLIKRRNGEALHQARVALRRLRSAFTLFKALLIGDESQRLKEELRWLAGILGDARDLDVLLEKAADEDLHERLRQAREAAYDEVVQALGSSRARALMLDFSEWLYCGDFQTAGATAPDAISTGDFAAMALDKMRKRLKKHGQALAEIDDEHRHEVRKDAKKLRYAAEFFSSLFNDQRGMRRYKRFIAAMEELQDELGALNDLATGPNVLAKFGLANHPARDLAIAHGDKSSLISKAQVSIEGVLDAKRFWR